MLWRYAAACCSWFVAFCPFNAPKVATAIANAMILSVGILNKTKKLVRSALLPLSILANSSGILRKNRLNGGGRL